MARLNRRVDGSGYYVTSIFTRHGVTKKVTYQTDPVAIEAFRDDGIRSGDKIPRHLFYELLEEGLLYTGKAGPGEELASDPIRPLRKTLDRVRERRQIPTEVTADLLNEDGSFITFGRFKLQYGGSDGYTDDVLRPAYHALGKNHQSWIEKQFREILSTHHPISIKKEQDRLIIEFAPGSAEQNGPPFSDSDYAIRQAERREKSRR